MKLSELFPDAALDDVRLYLEHTLVTTLVTIPQPNGEPPIIEPILGFVHELRPATGFVIIQEFTHNAKFMIPINEWDVSLFYPEIGMYSYRKTVVELSKNPMRQNKKGICPHTYCARNLFMPVIHSAHNSTRGANLPRSVVTGFCLDDGTRGLFNVITSEHRFFPLQESIKKILERRVFGKALSKDFAITAGHNSKFPLTLWRYDLPVAGLSGPDRMIVTLPAFFQEVFDQFGNQTEVTAL